MGYILHLMDTPADIKDSKSAEKFIFEQRALVPADNHKFGLFVQAITAIYPDLSEEDDDGDNDENLWEEGIDKNASYGNVKELVVKVDLTDQAVLDSLISAATRNGLTLYDSEGQVIY